MNGTNHPLTPALNNLLAIGATHTNTYNAPACAAMRAAVADLSCYDTRCNFFAGSIAGEFPALTGVSPISYPVNRGVNSERGGAANHLRSLGVQDSRIKPLITPTITTGVRQQALQAIHNALPAPFSLAWRPIPADDADETTYDLRWPQPPALNEDFGLFNRISTESTDCGEDGPGWPNLEKNIATLRLFFDSRRQAKLVFAVSPVFSKPSKMTDRDHELVHVIS